MKALGFDSGNNNKTTYIGMGFNKGVITDAQPEREYEYFEKITQGEHKGKYKPVLKFGYQDRRNEKEEVEMFDIIKSGKEIFVFDPKADPEAYTDEAISKRIKFIESQGRHKDLDFLMKR